jgi:hypothetical protein
MWAYPYPKNSVLNIHADGAMVSSYAHAPKSTYRI